MNIRYREFLEKDRIMMNIRRMEYLEHGPREKYIDGEVVRDRFKGRGLYDVQLRMLHNFFNHPKSVVISGRRCGKTTVMVELALWYMRRKRNTLYVCHNLEIAQEAAGTLEGRINGSYTRHGSTSGITIYRDGCVRFASMRQLPLKGFRPNFVILDEVVEDFPTEVIAHYEGIPIHAIATHVNITTIPYDFWVLRMSNTMED